MKKKVLSFIIYIITVVLISPATGQESDQDMESYFFSAIRANQQESYITFGGGFGTTDPLVFEAKVAPYFLLRTSDDAQWGATLSPTIIIRMYAEESFPVRTPSYMPHLTFYRKLGAGEHRLLQYVFLTLAHHSNGQEDPFYSEDGRINTLSGDFSTNYIELGAFFNKRVVPFANTTEYFKISLEYHFDYYRSADLQGQYGFLRWHNSFRVFRSIHSFKSFEFKKSARLMTTLNTSWIFGELNEAGTLDFNQRFNVSLTLAYRPSVLRDVGFFINFYTGKDYYNIHFSQRLSVIRAGIQTFTTR